MDLTRALRLVSTIAALAIVPASSGCSLLLDAPEGPTNRCAGDADCASSSCDVELGMCVREPEHPYTFVVRVALPADESVGRPGQAASAGPFVAPGPADSMPPVVVTRPVALTGQVRSDTVVLEADLVFVRANDGTPGPGIDPIVVATALADTNPLERPNDFVTELVPGHYDVEVRARGEHAAVFPPFRASIDLHEPSRASFEVPPVTAYTTIEGTVVDADGVAQDGLELRAIEVATGRRVSSIATTASMPEPGSFSLHVDPTATRWVLQVSAPAAYQAGGAFPTIAIDPSVLVPDERGRIQVLVPSSDSGRTVAGLVEFPGELGSMRPTVGATVTLRAREVRDLRTGIVGAFTLQMVTDAAGAFEGRVLPGTYAVEIRPLETELGVYVGEIVVADDMDQIGQIFEMPARTVLGGVVQRSADEPVADARVRAIAQGVPLPFEPMRSEALLNRPADGLSDAVGRFRLPLDVGVYDLVVEPPAGSGYPWLVRTGYGIGGADAAVTEVFDVRIPVAARGTATYDDGAPVANAEIEAYAIVGVDGLERAVAVGRASTDEDGHFVLLLPPEI